MSTRVFIAGVLLFAMALTGCGHRPCVPPIHRCLDALDARHAAGDRVTTADVEYCAIQAHTCSTDADCERKHGGQY